MIRDWLIYLTADPDMWLGTSDDRYAVVSKNPRLSSSIACIFSYLPFHSVTSPTLVCVTTSVPVDVVLRLHPPLPAIYYTYLENISPSPFCSSHV
jgi:hypothetical protein